MGTKRWTLNGELHRRDGPALEWPDGTKGWCLNGMRYKEGDYWEELFKRGIITKRELFLRLL
jgi:hypothetical protein